MNARNFILLSPGPVDGYPPVQYQARILADLGFRVELITPPANPDTKEPNFSHPNVIVNTVSAGEYFSRDTFRRTWAFIRKLATARRRANESTIEIDYDPLGMFYSDLTPFKPRLRIAHFHELLQHNSFVERRLATRIGSYQCVVAPDEGRAAHTQIALSMPAPPIVVPNYPMRAEAPLLASPNNKTSPFEVVYCGQLGTSQYLDVAIRSVALWPKDVSLVLIGNDKKPIAFQLKELAKTQGVADRVHFLGWLPTNEDVEQRMSMSDLGLSMLDSSNDQWRTALHASNKRFQYMKAGLPQIGDQNPGVPELLAGIGRCVKSHSPAEIAAIVTEYANDPLRRAQEGARAFARHQSEFNYEKVFQPLIDRMATW